ncbi:MAG TPA: methyltransferase domain-containing protein [Solirubrobacterales bacterium]|nr:methyltransferase domain-containing protein [Solirubrobacterales bacterium]
MTGSHFDDVAEVYDDTLPQHVTGHYLDKRTRFVLCQCPPPGRVLDVGCGTGAIAARLASAGYEVVGLDPSQGMLDVMRDRAPEVRAVHGSATEMPLDDGEFDLSLAVATMHHIARPDAVRRALSEMVRVVRPGGRILVWDHNPRNPYWPYLMRRVPQDTGEERLIGVGELLSGIRDAGAKPLLVTQLGLVPDFTPQPAMRLAAAVERVVERMPLVRRICAHNVVLAAKR